MTGILVSVDVEASGPAPGHGDMISFAVIVIEPNFGWQFWSMNMKPECNVYHPAAYQAIGMSRATHLAAKVTIEETMQRFKNWTDELLEATGENRLIMVSDNPGFDFQWINFECWNKLGCNPFGHSARRIGDVWSGLRERYYETKGWHRYRRTEHTHNPVDDAMGNAEAWLAMWEKHGGHKAQKEIEKLRKRFQQISDNYIPSSGEGSNVSVSYEPSNSMGINWPRL